MATSDLEALGFTVIDMQAMGIKDFDGNDNSKNYLVFGTVKGNDIETAGGDDFICGGNGDDDIDSGAGDDVVFGGNQHDEIDLGPGNDFAHGGNGKDDIEGGAGDDCIFGGTGKDDLEGDGGDDIIDGGDQADEIDGDGGNDILVGGNGPDDIDGGDGDDIITGGLGPDEIDGGDEVNGDTHNDFEEIDDVEDIENSEVGNPTDLSCNLEAIFALGDNPSDFVPDMAPPKVHKHGDDEIEIELFSTFNDPGVDCDDDEDGESLYCITDDSEIDNTQTGSYTVHYITFDAAGNSGTESRIVTVVDTPVSTALNIAMICDRSDCNNKNKDVPLREHLISGGHTVTTFADSNISWSPAGYDLIVISESVLSKNTAWLHSVTVPIFTVEGANNDELALGLKGKSNKGGSNSIVIQGNHPITSGFTDGQIVQVTISDKHLGYMVKDPASTVEQLGYYQGSSSYGKILVADSGALLADGSTAQAKRVFFGAQYFADLTADGKTIVDNAILWAVT